MLRDFKKDLMAAKEAERLVQMYFTILSDEWSFSDVSEVSEYYYKGDILATNSSGRRIGIEVKDDSRIADTGNVLCEDCVYYLDGCYFGKGNMSSDYDIYCVVSQREKKIYVIDFKVLKQIYKKYGTYKQIDHSDQTTFCYLLPLEVIKKKCAFIAEVDYSGESPEAKVYDRAKEAAEEAARLLEAKRIYDEKIKEYGSLDKWIAAVI